MHQKRRVLLHAIDEDEAARVLQLALHDLQIEEPLKARGVDRRFVDEVRDEGVEQRRRERHVRVAQEPDEIVGARSEERVLEVDDAQARSAVTSCTIKLRD